MDRHLAIRNTHPSVVTINGDTDATDVNGTTVVLDETLIKAEISQLQTEYDNNQYQRDRQYPSIGDQLDMIFHAGLGGDAFQAAIQAVKDKHPKGDN
jgi:hypothetical protein